MTPAEPPPADEGGVRVGFPVTRKVGNAVERNRAKRRLRAAAAEVFSRLGRAGTDYVVVGRIGTLSRPFAALLADLEQAVRKLDGGRAGSEQRRDGDAARRPARDRRGPSARSVHGDRKST